MAKRGKLNSKKGVMTEKLRPFNCAINLNHTEDVTVENVIHRVRNIVVVDGDDDDIADSNNSKMLEQFRAALEEEERHNANVDQVLNVDKEDDDITLDELVALIRNREE